jgi:P2-related tail formation protein
VEIRFKERIQFGVELQLAKQKIDECLKEWTTDSNINLRAIINEAFQVDKKGEIAKYRILGLRRYNIKDPTWKEAMELIDQAINVTSTKQYVAFYERDAAGDYQQIILNFSAL